MAEHFNPPPWWGGAPPAHFSCRCTLREVQWQVGDAVVVHAPERGPGWSWPAVVVAVGEIDAAPGYRVRRPSGAEALVVGSAVWPGSDRVTDLNLDQRGGRA